MADFVVLVLIGAISSATPLILAGLGEVVLERSGAGIGLGLEGTMVSGALAGVLGAALAGPWVGLGAGVVVGLGFGVLYAAALACGGDGVLIGITLTLLGTGLSTYVAQVADPAGNTALSVPTLPTISLPGLEQLPVLGPLFTGTSVSAYLAIAATLAVWWMLRASRLGLRLRAVGDDPVSASVLGISVRRHRATAALIAGGFGGLAGAVLSLSSIGSFAPMMSAGRGFIVLAVVILARRHPIGVGATALMIGIFDSLALLAQTRSLGLPVEAYQLLPWIASIVLLIVDGRRRARRAHHLPPQKEPT
ncbi:ABC transporter permease [Amycolatopsis sp. WAC 04182]|uniref:ABC transporter permease n=1 Tax=Amycolatopsis sp. WAC 04182 TaxID=2203198 RepID=UPI000F779598|nr:ABC transporter permease [Amycolatopsis sp. WAC 04182]